MWAGMAAGANRVSAVSIVAYRQNSAEFKEPEKETVERC